MDPHNNPFVVDQLRPEGLSGETGKTYQLTNASVNPTRIVGRDALGMPIEETIPACYSRPFVHPCGAVNNVPLRTGPVFDMEPASVRYEQTEMQRLITNGWLPLWVCPYTAEFSYLGVPGPLVRPPDGEQDCGGSPKGCSHMHKVMADRTAFRRKLYDEDMKRHREMTDADQIKLIESITEGFSNAMARNNPQDIQARREALKKSEQK